MLQATIQNEISQSTSLTRSGDDVFSISQSLADINDINTIFITAKAAFEKVAELIQTKQICRIGLVAPTNLELKYYLVPLLLHTIPNEFNPKYSFTKDCVELEGGIRIDLTSSENADIGLRGRLYQLAVAHAPHLWKDRKYTWELLNLCMRFGPNSQILISAQ